MCDEIHIIVTSFKHKVMTIPTSRNEGVRTPILVSPKIKISKFDGIMIFCCSYRNMFNLMVHENNEYSDIERIHYLMSYLSGPAIILVKMVPLTAHNYSIAWNALQSRYEN